MKGSIEDRYLLHTRQDVFDRLDTFQIYRVMQWREIGEASDRGFDLRRNHHTFTIYIAAMYHPVTDNRNFRRLINYSRRAAAQRFQQSRNDFMPRTGGQF